MSACLTRMQGCLPLYGGAGAFANVRQGRINRTTFFKNDREKFLRQLIVEILALERKAKRENLIPAIRLNGTSDLAWESFKVDGKSIMEHFPHIQFYDYTKSEFRMLQLLRGFMPKNYHLTFSRSETNHEKVERVAAAGGNIAVVFRGGLPQTYLNREVIDGDLSDIRFNDPLGVVVGLKAKGRARKQEEGFVVQVNN